MINYSTHEYCQSISIRIITFSDKLYVLYVRSKYRYFKTTIHNYTLFQALKTANEKRYNEKYFQFSGLVHYISLIDQAMLKETSSPTKMVILSHINTH